MLDVLKAAVSVINRLHDILLLVVGKLGLRFNDKQLHFWVLGLIGIVLFVAVDVAFRRISKWSVSALSFIYTLTVLVVIALSMEIQQQITRRGALDFNDIIAGIWGFIVLLGLYVLVRIAIRVGSKLYQKVIDKRR
ncbi:MAG: hypothetical protein ABIK79_09630 [Chloroflexota bacterium]|nr:hypothetical protein [Anaerolineae bacterium]